MHTELIISTNTIIITQQRSKESVISKLYLAGSFILDTSFCRLDDAIALSIGSESGVLEFWNCAIRIL